MLRVYLCIAGFLFFIASAHAQTGFPPYGSFEPGGFDVVNRQNLNVNFSIPIAAFPGRGRGFGFSVVHDSLVWRRSGGLWQPVADWGWKKDRPVGTITYLRLTQWCSPGGPKSESYPVYRYMNYSFTAPDGTVHSFGLDFYEWETDCNFPTEPRKAHASDGSGYFIDATSPESPKVFDSSGNELTNVQAVDTNGNFVSRQVISSTETHWKDTRGKIVLKIIKVSDEALEYHVLDINGSYQVTTVTHTNFNIRTNFGCSGVSEYNSSG